MKKTVLFFVSVIIISGNLIAQPKSTFFDNWHLTLHTGPTIFLGDVTQQREWYKLDLSSLRMALGVNLTKEINCTFALRGQFGYGWVAGKKDFFKNGDPAGLSFKAHFYHINGQLKVNFIDLFAGGRCYRKFNVYGFAGLGFINFQNRLFKDGVEVLSWGFGRSGTAKWVTEVTVPFGIGADVRFGQKWRLNLDIEAIWVDNEKLDRVVGGYEHDAMIYPNLGVTYNLSKNNRVCCKKINYTPEFVAVTGNKIPADTCAKLLAKADSLKNLVDQSVLKIDKLINNIDLVQNKLDSCRNHKDTVYIVKEGTKYPDSVNAVMKRAGYIWYNVYFNFDKYNITPKYDSVITKVAEIMKSEPGLKVRVVGNADQRGALKYNEILSQNRAKEVIKTLVNKHGIDRNRLVLEFRGEREPISNIHFQLNRRVDFIKIEK
jgi:outer membrane protein OmpA-like peptidoglycan-associated protein